MVPEGTFQSTRISKNRKGDDGRARTDVFKVPSSVTRTFAAFPAAYPAQSSPYPGPSPPTFTQEPYRISPQASHPPAFRHPSEIPQYSVPPPLPPLGSLHTLPPLRPEAEDIEYKFRRPSLPAISEYPLHAPSRDRRAAFDQGRFAEYPPIPHPAPLPRPATSLAPSSPVEDRDTQYRPELACTYTGSLRESTSNFDRPSSTAVGMFQPTPDTSGQDESPFVYSSQAQPTHNNYSQISLPPPAQLFRCDAPTELYAVRTTEDSVGAIGSTRVDLAPLHSLQRRPYRRDPVDDMALRSLGPRSG